MLIQKERPVCIPEITDLNRLKWELNQLPAVDTGEYIAELPLERQAIAFRLLNKNQATNVFEYLPPDVQESLISSLHAADVRTIGQNCSTNYLPALSNGYYSNSVQRKGKRLPEFWVTQKERRDGS
jgi:magnesium transporter